MSFLSDPSLWGLSLLSASSKASFLRRWQLCPKCWWGCGVTETLRGWNAKWHSYTGKQLSSFLKSLSYVSHMIHPPHSWVFTQEKWNQLSTQSLEQGCSQQPYSHQPKKVELNQMSVQVNGHIHWHICAMDQSWMTKRNKPSRPTTLWMNLK